MQEYTGIIMLLKPHHTINANQKSKTNVPSSGKTDLIKSYVYL
ncbi:hypothetical protein YPC_2751 [Yersinia pestis biovar Medievalis str. Harbin 35]|nr:hypothetical protein YPC_2751 [Yersinia pestis biovar Medievalis str. Harbin 35]EEO75000.1 hypothetical protein YP516_2884 [Yersinia pestis Nepal516]EEO81901.1 hypothetical protein YPF_1879 [Yersinia pestis biovar Orientalis str. India 195]EEO87801.1 hypothetical protein YPH_3771 [Yersinia pestis biovar Orientalis str. PEXU2]EEO88820.1 hypothetical protein YPS_3670 [Yersinia pestis Pestoides A]EIR36029.1 hypothetical protein YPPY11_1784 [Yersinia pestis PY-11]EIS80663.1 hypothetical protei